MENQQILVMACATVMEEMLPLLPPGMRHEVFDFGLHINPEKLHHTLQQAIDHVEGDITTILLGYGLCSQAVIGIQSDRFRLVVPRVDDCIAIFLGSRAAYHQQNRTEPGTYYLTKGWIEVGDTPFTEYEGMVARYGEVRAQRLMKTILAHYKRLALINTGQYDLEHYREYAQKTAQRFDLNYEEIDGSNVLIQKMLSGDWNEEFIVVEPGETIQYRHFYPD